MLNMLYSFCVMSLLRIVGTVYFCSSER